MLKPDHGTASAAAENPRNCVPCKQRKIRCDRREPCSNCLRGNRVCEFPTSGRALRRPEPRSGAGGRRGTAKQAELMDRIRRLEAVVDDLNKEMDVDADAGAPPLRPLAGGVAAAAVAFPSGAEGPAVAAAAAAASPFDAAPSAAPHTRHVSHDEASDGRTQSVVDFSSPSWHRRSGSVQKSPQPGGELGMMLSDDQGSLYVGNRFWANLQHEVRCIRERLEDLDAGSEDADSVWGKNSSESTPTYRFDNGSSFVFGNFPGGGSPRLKDLRPLPSQTLFIWQTYVENVDPFVKVLHVPTVSKIIHDSGGNFEHMDHVTEVLMFSVSLAAVCSLSDEEARTNFRANRDELMARFRLGTELALVQADFIHTAKLAVVQAFTIYLSAIRPEESMRYMWSLLGLLMRLAICLGLHRDGSRFRGISPFVAEMRRRTWWHICFLDLLVGHLQAPGLSPGIEDANTRPPANVNDADLSPDMTAPPVPREGHTESLFCIVRCELWRTCRQLRRTLCTEGDGVALIHGHEDNNAFADEDGEEDWYGNRDKDKDNKSGSNGGPTDSAALAQKLYAAIDAVRERIYTKYLNRIPADQPLRPIIVAHVELAIKRYELGVDQVCPQHPLVFLPNPAVDPDPTATCVGTQASFSRALYILRTLLAFQINPALRRWASQMRGDVHCLPVAVVLSRLCCPGAAWDARAERAWTIVGAILGPGRMFSEAVRREPLWAPVWKLAAQARKRREEQRRAMHTVEGFGNGHGTKGDEEVCAVIGAVTGADVRMGAGLNGANGGLPLHHHHHHHHVDEEEEEEEDIALLSWHPPPGLYALGGRPNGESGVGTVASPSFRLDTEVIAPRSRAWNSRGWDASVDDAAAGMMALCTASVEGNTAPSDWETHKDCSNCSNRLSTPSASTGAASDRLNAGVQIAPPPQPLPQDLHTGLGPGFASNEAPPGWLSGASNDGAWETVLGMGNGGPGLPGLVPGSELGFEPLDGASRGGDGGGADSSNGMEWEQLQEIVASDWRVLLWSSGFA